jgi:hypothetical protein
MGRRDPPRPEALNPCSCLSHGPFRAARAACAWPAASRPLRESPSRESLSREQVGRHAYRGSPPPQDVTAVTGAALTG